MFHFALVALYSLQSFASSNESLPKPIMLSNSAKGRVVARLTARKSYCRDDFLDAIFIEDISLLGKIVESNTVPIDYKIAQAGIFAKNPDVLDFLLSRADPADQDNFEKAPLKLADMALSAVCGNSSSLDHLECILKHGHCPSLNTMEALISNKDHDLVLRTVFSYFTGTVGGNLMDAYFSRGQDNPWIVEGLVKLGCTVDASSRSSRKPYLYTAVELGLYDTVKVILRLGADPDATFFRYDFAQSVLELALQLNRLDCFSILVEQGADPFISDNQCPKHKRWLQALQYKKAFIVLSAGVIDDGSPLFMIPTETLGEIFSHLV